jgi:hypothetical protein
MNVVNLSENIGVKIVLTQQGEITMADYSNATNQELYEIATNDTNRLVDRYKAAKELQRRKKGNAN